MKGWKGGWSCRGNKQALKSGACRRLFSGGVFRGRMQHHVNSEIRSINGRRYAEMPFKQMVKVAAVVIARGKGHLSDGKPRIF